MYWNLLKDVKKLTLILTFLQTFLPVSGFSVWSRPEAFSGIGTAGLDGTGSGKASAMCHICHVVDEKT